MLWTGMKSTTGIDTQRPACDTRSGCSQAGLFEIGGGALETEEKEFDTHEREYQNAVLLGRPVLFLAGSHLH